jgi:hypothetical protein
MRGSQRARNRAIPARALPAPDAALIAAGCQAGGLKGAPIGVEAWGALTRGGLVDEFEDARIDVIGRNVAACGAVQPQPQVLPSQQWRLGKPGGSPVPD